MKDENKRVLRVTGITTLAVVAVGTLAALLVRDQISRQRRNLFNPLAIRRMAALEHVARQHPSVDHLNLLRDYLAWEPRKLLRERARTILARLERKALERTGPVEEPVG
jgi:hypothetical protein